MRLELRVTEGALGWNYLIFRGGIATDIHIYIGSDEEDQLVREIIHLWNEWSPDAQTCD